MTVAESSDLLREFSRRRVNLFFSSVILVAFLGVLIDEMGDLIDVVDDGGLVVLAIITIAIIALTWKKNTPQQLKSTNNIVMIIALVMIALTIFGIYNEMGDSKAFGDDIAQMIVTVALLLNRFVP
jgi:nicotinamide riboside transporter PnuC